jgi:sugar lactone lactonase YvrE
MAKKASTMFRLAGFGFFILILTLAFEIVVAPHLIALGDRILSRNPDEIAAHCYLLIPIAVAGAVTLILWLQTPPYHVRSKITISALLFSFAFSAANITLGTVNISSEESKMAGATGFALLVSALSNYSHYWLHRYHFKSRPRTQFFWYILFLAFTFAAADELFVLHERAGKVMHRVMSFLPIERNPLFAIEMQDLITVGYAVAGIGLALVVLVYFWNSFHMKMLFSGVDTIQYPFILLAAATLYFMSVLLDTFDWLGESIAQTIDLVYLANATEEVLELTAASLFAAAFSVALLESNDKVLLKSASSFLRQGYAEGEKKRYVTHWTYASFIVCVLILMVSTGFSGGLLHESDRYEAVVVSTRGEHNLLSPDGIFYLQNTLYVANDQTSSVMAIGATGESLVLADKTAGLQTPESVVAMMDGSIYFTDDKVGSVFMVRKGELPEKILTSLDGIKAPKGIALDKEGSLYVVDEDNTSILKFSNGKRSVVVEFAGFGKPEEVAFDRYGNLYATQESPPRIFKATFGSKPSVFKDESSGLGAPEGIAVDGDYIYVTDSKSSAVFRFSLSGEGGRLFTLKKSYGRWLEGVALDEHGSIYVAVRRGRRSAILKIRERIPRS